MIGQTYHDLPIIFIFLFIILSAGLFILYHTRRIKNKKTKRILELQVVKRNGSVSKSWFYGFSSLIFNYNTNEVALYTVPGGRYSPPRTYLKIIFQPPMPQKMFIYKGGVASKIGKTLGMQDIQIGIDSFDREVIIKGSDEFF